MDSIRELLRELKYTLLVIVIFATVFWVANNLVEFFFWGGVAVFVISLPLGWLMDRNSGLYGMKVIPFLGLVVMIVCFIIAWAIHSSSSSP